MSIGIVLRNCRRLKNITLIELAQTVHVSESYLSLIENGKRRINLSMLEKLTQALQIPMTLIIYLSYDQSNKPLNDKLSLFAAKAIMKLV